MHIHQASSWLAEREAGNNHFFHNPHNFLVSFLSLLMTETQLPSLLFLEHPNQHTVIFTRSNSNGRIRQFQYLTVISTYYLSIPLLLYILKCYEVIIATNVHSMQKRSSERITGEGGGCSGSRQNSGRGGKRLF